MEEFHAIDLINAINVERKKVGQHIIPASDDMCATALFKGLVQKVDKYKTMSMSKELNGT